MLAKTGGNMSEVYREWHRMQEIADQAEAWANDPSRSTARLEAEVSEATPAQWFLVHTFPGDDVRAMRWLARRRFGVFQPRQQRTTKGGILVQGWQAIFPGWLMVYTWDINRMLPRILACPGVMDLFCEPVSLRPVPIPDWFVAELRQPEFEYRDNAPRPGHYRVHSERHIKRRIPPPTKKQRKELDTLKKQARQIGIGWDQHAWEQIRALDPYHRIEVLQRALLQNQNRNRAA